MNVWDIATIAGFARIAFGLLVVGLLVIWLAHRERRHPERVRAHTRSGHDSR